MQRQRPLRDLFLLAAIAASAIPAAAANSPFAMSLQVNSQTATMLLPSNLGATILVTVPNGAPGPVRREGRVQVERDRGRPGFDRRDRTVGAVRRRDGPHDLPGGSHDVEAAPVEGRLVCRHRLQPRRRELRRDAGGRGNADGQEGRDAHRRHPFRDREARDDHHRRGAAPPNNKPDGDPAAGAQLQAWFHGTAQPAKTTAADGKVSWSWAVPPGLNDPKVTLSFKHAADDVYDFSYADKDVATHLTINPGVMRKDLIPK